MVEMDPAEERTLALRAARGDPEAFGELVRRHQSAVFNVAYRLLGEAREAEDAAQEAFIRAYRFFPHYDVNLPLLPWLRKIATNVCLKRMGRAGLEVEVPQEEDGPPAGDPPPEAVIVGREREARIRREILRLPPRQRIVIELRHFGELSYEEIARTLDRPVSDVKSDLFRARRALALHLKDLRT